MTAMKSAEAANPRGPAWADAFEPSKIPLQETYKVGCKVSPEELFGQICRLGGRVGWHGTDALWRLRGEIDRLFGGVGMRKARRDPVSLQPDDPVDFWRVEEVGPGPRLLLRAEMKNPGTAWLELEARPAPGGSELVETSYFRPMPFWGRLYYYAMFPTHWAVFRHLAHGLARAAERDAGAAPRPS